MEFKKKYSLEKRKNESNKILNKYEGRIPIILERKNKYDFPEIVKIKYLVPTEITITQFLKVVRKRANISDTKSIFLLLEKEIIPLNDNTIGCIYNDYKNEDGFLYLIIQSENVFG